MTLVELMVTLSVLVIIVAVGVPLFDSVVSNNRVIKQTNDLVGTLILARSEAIKRRLPVSICASADQATCANSSDWSTGWIIFSDNSGTSGVLDGTDVLIHAYQAIGGSSSLTATANAVQYRRTGSLATTSGPVFTLTGAVCTGNSKRVITVMPPGHSWLDKAACS